MVDTVIVHDPDHLGAVFDAASAANRPLLAITAEWAGIAYGALYWAKALEHLRASQPDASVEIALHCGDDAGRALGALREGWKRILFTGKARVRVKISDIASQQRAELIEEPDDTALDLGGTVDPAAAIEAWIAAGRRCK